MGAKRKLRGSFFLQSLFVQRFLDSTSIDCRSAGSGPGSTGATGLVGSQSAKVPKCQTLGKAPIPWQLEVLDGQSSLFYSIPRATVTAFSRISLLCLITLQYYPRFLSFPPLLSPRRQSLVSSVAFDSVSSPSRRSKLHNNYAVARIRTIIIINNNKTGGDPVHLLTSLAIAL